MDNTDNNVRIVMAFSVKAMLIRVIRDSKNGRVKVLLGCFWSQGKILKKMREGLFRNETPIILCSALAMKTVFGSARRVVPSPLSIWNRITGEKEAETKSNKI